MLESSSEEDPRDGTTHRNSLHIAMDFSSGTFGHLGTGSVRDTSTLQNEHCQSQFLLSCMIQGSFSGWNDCRLMGGALQWIGRASSCRVQAHATPLTERDAFSHASAHGHQPCCFPICFSCSLGNHVSPASVAENSECGSVGVLSFKLSLLASFPKPRLGGFTPGSPLFF